MNGDATSAPPPTPSTHHPNSPFPTSDAASADALSMLLHRLPPTFSLPTRRRSPPATCPPAIPFSDVQANPTGLSFASQLGFFQLANSAESEAPSLLDLPKPQKQSVLPDCWPLEFEEDDHKDGKTLGESFCMDSSSSAESTELGLASLPKFSHCSVTQQQPKFFKPKAKVWKNGKLKTARERPVAMSMLVTLPIHSRVSPFLLSQATAKNNSHRDHPNAMEMAEIVMKKLVGEGKVV